MIEYNWEEMTWGGQCFNFKEYDGGYFEIRDSKCGMEPHLIVSVDGSIAELDSDMVRKIIPLLNNFVNTGNIRIS